MVDTGVRWKLNQLLKLLLSTTAKTRDISVDVEDTEAGKEATRVDTGH